MSVDRHVLSSRVGGKSGSRHSSCNLIKRWQAQKEGFEALFEEKAL